MGTRGFYLSIDAAISAAVALLVLTLLVMAIKDYEFPTHTSLVRYKLAESAVYSLEGSGTLGQAAAFLDAGNSSLATTLLLSKLAEMHLPGSVQLELRLYDSALASTHNFTAANGKLGEDVHAVNIVFSTNSTSRYGIAMMRTGGSK